MRRSAAAVSGILAMVASAGATLAAGVEVLYLDAIAVERGVAQLFIDDELIATQDNLKRTLHQPVKDDGGNVPIIASGPNSSLWAYGTIVYDTRREKYVMFIQEFPSRAMFLTTSEDGLTWDARTHDELTPVTMDMDLGELPPEAGRFEIDLFSCFYDKNDPEFPYKGWAWFANAGYEWEGIWYLRSRDGLDWERPHQILDGYAGPGDPTYRSITQDGRTLYGPGDVTTFYYDEVEDRFLGLFKFFSPYPVRPGFGSRSRAYAFFDRMDEPIDPDIFTHVELVPPMAEKDGDHLFDEYYASTAWRYESLWLGGLKIFHTRGDYPYSAADCAFLKLVVSRDGLHWNKVPFANDDGIPEVFIANGPEGGNDGQNDGGYICEFSQGPLRIGDELIYYYTSTSRGKQPHPRRLMGGGLFRARLRIDGFVSVDWGTLTTRPLILEGDDLTVNGIGPITVRALDAGGNPLAVARIEEGDSLAHPVTFDGRTLSELTDDGTVRLQFEVDWRGRLYSFKVD